MKSPDLAIIGCAFGVFSCGVGVEVELLDDETQGRDSVTASSVCVRSGAPIEESFRIMLGRNPTRDEVVLYSKLMVTGVQVAYFEPYVQDLGARDAGCATWVGTVSDAGMGGIPYNTASLSGGTSNASEWTSAGGNLSQFIAATVRTAQCRLPTSADVEALNRVYRSGYATAVGGGKSQLEAGRRGYAAVKDAVQMHAVKTPCLDVLDDITRRIWGRVIDPAKLGTCALDPTRPPTERASDCWFLWTLRFGQPGPGWVNELIHSARSTREAITRNEPASCLEAGALPVNPHALGEYVAQLYRLLLGRTPSEPEIEAMVAQSGYQSGSTTRALKFVVRQLMNSAEYRGRTTCVAEVPL